MKIFFLAPPLSKSDFPFSTALCPLAFPLRQFSGKYVFVLSLSRDFKSERILREDLAVPVLAPSVLFSFVLRDADLIFCPSNDFFFF